MNSKGRFIVFEGIDGAGKSTQCRRLYEYIKNLNIPAVMLAEPTSGEYGRKIRHSLRSGISMSINDQMELFIKDRQDDFRTNIKPALEKGLTIVMDRYFYSNAAYQGSDILTPEMIITMNLEQGFPEPDRVYFVDLPSDLAMSRIKTRSGDNTELFEKHTFLEKVRKNFLKIAGTTPVFLHIDGSLNEVDLFELIKKDFHEYFG